MIYTSDNILLLVFGVGAVIGEQQLVDLFRSGEDQIVVRGYCRLILGYVPLQTLDLLLGRSILLLELLNHLRGLAVQHLYLL